MYSARDISNIIDLSETCNLKHDDIDFNMLILPLSNLSMREN